MVYQVPGGQFIENAIGQFAPTGGALPITQQWHDATEVEQAVKVCAAQVDAGGGQNVATAVMGAWLSGAQLDDGKV